MTVQDVTPFSRSGTESQRSTSWAVDLGKRAAARMVGAGALQGAPARGPIQVIDLFCGAGGLSAGFELVGRMEPSFRLLAAVDIDPYSAQTYSRNLPITPQLLDLAQVASNRSASSQFVRSLGIDQSKPLVLIGGPPCQGFSAHRKKDGRHDDARNKLLLAFAKFATLLKPDFVVFENVPEVMAEKNWDLFSGMHRSFERAGYNFKTQIHNLADFGVPQARFRALVIAAKKQFRMPEPYVSSQDHRTVRQTISSLPKAQPGQQNSADPMHICSNHRRSTIETIRKVPRDGGSRPKGVGPRCLQTVDGFRDVYGRLYWDKPANTITAFARNPASGRYVHPEQHRGLTVREAALLQGFPKDYHFEGPFDDKFLQIGNAVPPIFAAYLAAHILGEMKSTSTAPLQLSKNNLMLPTSNSFSSGIAGRKKAIR